LLRWGFFPAIKSIAPLAHSATAGHAQSLRGNSLLFRLEMGRHFPPLLGKLAIGALRLRISCDGRCVRALLRLSPTFLRPIGHSQTLISRPPAQTLPAMPRGRKRHTAAENVNTAFFAPVVRRLHPSFR